MKTIEFNQNTLQYHVLNSKSDKCIFFVHGLGDNWHSFDNVIDAVATWGYKIVYFDLPGCSENKDVEAMFADYPKLLLKILKKEKQKENYVVAHSMGGLIALLAQLQTKQITKLIAIEPSITKPDFEFFNFVQEPPIGIGFDELKMIKGNEVGYLKQYKKNLNNTNSAIIKENIKTIFDKFHLHQKEILEGEKPFIYCYGLKSSKPNERDNMRNFPFIKVYPFENAEHWVHKDNPQLFIEFLKQALQ